MTKQNKAIKKKTLPKLLKKTNKVVIDKELKDLLRSLPSWPGVKVADWMPVVVKKWKVGKKLTYKTDEYKKVNEFV